MKNVSGAKRGSGAVWAVYFGSSPELCFCHQVAEIVMRSQSKARPSRCVTFNRSLSAPTVPRNAARYTSARRSPPAGHRAPNSQSAASSLVGISLKELSCGRSECLGFTEKLTHQCMKAT